MGALEKLKHKVIIIQEQFMSLPGEKFPHILPEQTSCKKILPLFLSHRAATFSETKDGSNPHSVSYVESNDNL